jgi:hemoglobin
MGGGAVQGAMMRCGRLFLLSVLAGGCWSDPDAGTRPIERVKEPEKSLYERLGGESGIAKIVDEWIGRSLNNPRVNFARRGTEMRWVPADSNIARVKAGFVEFISSASGGPVKYEGRETKSVHQGMAISGGEFDAMKKDLKETLWMMKVKEKEQKELFKIVESVRKEIVEVP